jgi:hypothetical protein
MGAATVLVWDALVDSQWDRKLEDRWNGPYIIVEVRSGGTYMLKELDGQVLQTIKFYSLHFL